MTLPNNDAGDGTPFSEGPYSVNGCFNFWQLGHQAIHIVDKTDRYCRSGCIALANRKCHNLRPTQILTLLPIDLTRPQ